MIKFSRERVLLLHKFITEETGTSGDLRDASLLDSALESAFQTFDGIELYPSKEEKGARIACSLIQNHPFTDGNKRIGMYFLITFLKVNGMDLNCTDEDIIEIGLELASGKASYDTLLFWIYEHIV